MGYAPEFVGGMLKKLQANELNNFVLATNETHTVREFLEEWFSNLTEKIELIGKGIEEKGYLKRVGQLMIAIDPRYFWPTEVELLIGKAWKIQGWNPKTTFKELVQIMILFDFNKISWNFNFYRVYFINKNVW